MNQEAVFSHARSAAFGAVLFLAFVLAGAGYIVWAKHTGSLPLLVTGIPLVLMILYAVILGLARYFRLRDDQAGDNLYYLGFLYTLTSLGVSLWQFSVSDGGVSIVTNFGIAIASTILGVALRVVFNQMRQDPVEVERVARLELADAARKIKQELDAATFEFSSFRRSTQQILEESLRETREMFENLAKTIFDDLKEILAQSAKPLQAASEQSRETIEKLSKDVLDHIKYTGKTLTTEEKNLAVTTASLSSSVQELEARLKAMKSPEGIIEIKLQPFIRGFTKAIKDQSEATDTQMAALKEIIETFDSSVRSLSTHLAQVSQDRAVDQQAVRDIAAKMNNATDETQRLLAELVKNRTATPTVLVDRPGLSRGWSLFNRGGSS